MPSKLRILFRGPGNPRFICGNKAIAMLSQFVSKECLLTMQLPLDWGKRNKYSRLSFLAQLLPKGYELYLIREPKHTRKNKSLYLKMKDKVFKSQGYKSFDKQIMYDMLVAPVPNLRQPAPNIQQEMDNGHIDQLWGQAVNVPAVPRPFRVRRRIP